MHVPACRRSQARSLALRRWADRLVTSTWPHRRGQLALQGCPLRPAKRLGIHTTHACRQRSLRERKKKKYKPSEARIAAMPTPRSASKALPVSLPVSETIMSTSGPLFWALSITHRHHPIAGDRRVPDGETHGAWALRSSLGFHRPEWPSATGFLGHYIHTRRLT